MPKLLRAHLIMRNRFQIYQKPVSDSAVFCIQLATLKPVSRNDRNLVETFSVAKLEIVHLFMLNYLLWSSLKLRLKVTYTYTTRSTLKYFDRYIGTYERGTFISVDTSFYNFIIKYGVSCRLGNGWLMVLCIRFAH